MRKGVHAILFKFLIAFATLWPDCNLKYLYPNSNLPGECVRIQLITNIDGTLVINKFINDVLESAL